LLQAEQRLSRGPVEVAENKFTIAKHGVAGKRIESKFEAAIFIRGVRVRGRFI
jgi:hypothetical protein